MIRFISKVSQGWQVDSAAKLFQYPGGEWSLNLEKAENEQPLYAYVTFEPQKHNMSEELTQLALWADWCHSKNQPAKIVMPYLPAARADRGTPFGGKVYAAMINAINADEVIILDAHSHVVPEMINNCKSISPARLIKQNIMNRHGSTEPYTAVIAPDKGAVERASSAAKLLKLPLIKADKGRDFATGNLTHYEIDLSDAPEHGAFLVVDDICDGGGTFKLLAQSSKLPRERLGLWVSHGIFSGKADELKDSYAHIYTTDSIAPYQSVATHVAHSLPYLLWEAELQNA